MTKEEFKRFIKEEMYKRNFKWSKGMYYLPFGDSMLCGVRLQKSNYGPIYYIRVYFSIEPQTQYPSHHDHDIYSSFKLVSKRTDDFVGPVEYEYYDYGELSDWFAEQYNALILPVLENGKKYILDNLKKIYIMHPLKEKEILQKLTQP